MSKFSLIFVFVFFMGGFLSAQTHTDSLLNILRTQNPDEKQRMELFFQIAKDYNNSNNDSAGYYAGAGLKLAESSGNYNYSVKNLIILGDIAIRQDSLKQAQDFYLKAAGLSDKVTDNHAILSVWIMLGYINNLTANYDKALKYYFKGLYLADSLGIKKFISRFYNNIGGIYSNTGDHKKGIAYYFRALKIFKESKEEGLYANTLLNIGVNYYDLGMPDSALSYLNRSKEINEKLNNHYGLVNYYVNMAEMEYDAGNFGKALEKIQLELKEIEYLDKSFFGSNAYNRTGALIFLGNIYVKLNEYQKAIKSYREAKYLAEKSSFLNYIAGASEGLSNVYEKSGRIDSAFAYYKLYKKYDDSVHKDDVSRKISLLEMDFKMKNERKVAQLEKERMQYEQKITRLVYLSITGILVTGLIILVFLYIHQKDKNKQSFLQEQNLNLEKEKLEKELELKNKELTTNVMYLLKKNEFIGEISSRLKSIDDKKGSLRSSQIVEVIKELDRNTSGEVWMEFEKRFMDVYGDFYERLNTKFPNLTPNELKLCAFLKLNMSTKEISSITYQSPETLKTARHRLRKKLGLSREDNIVAFLNQI